MVSCWVSQNGRPALCDWRQTHSASHTASPVHATSIRLAYALSHTGDVKRYVRAAGHIMHAVASGVCAGSHHHRCIGRMVASRIVVFSLRISRDSADLSGRVLLPVDLAVLCLIFRILHQYSSTSDKMTDPEPSPNATSQGSAATPSAASDVAAATDTYSTAPVAPTPTVAATSTTTSDALQTSLVVSTQLLLGNRASNTAFCVSIYTLKPEIDTDLKSSAAINSSSSKTAQSDSAAAAVASEKAPSSSAVHNSGSNKVCKRSTHDVLFLVVLTMILIVAGRPWSACWRYNWRFLWWVHPGTDGSFPL
jgi:hypothetical protein